MDRKAIAEQLVLAAQEIVAVTESRKWLDELMTKAIGLRWVTQGAPFSATEKAMARYLSKDEALKLIDMLDRDNELHPDVIAFLRAKTNQRER